MIHHDDTRTLTYPHHTSPRYRSLEYLRTFLSAEVAAARVFSAHRRRNKSISSQRLPHSRIYSSYVSHARLLKSALERERISRVDTRPRHESSPQHVGGGCAFPSLLHRGRRSPCFFFSCYTRYTN